MSKVPKNVQKTLDFNQTIEKASAYANDIQTCSVKAKWFEHDFQRLQNLGASIPKPSGREDATQRRRLEGVSRGIEAVKVARQARLKELYEREALQYDAELQRMGLSLVKPRD